MSGDDSISFKAGIPSYGCSITSVHRTKGLLRSTLIADRLPVTQAPPQSYPPRPYPLPTLAPLQFYLSPNGQLSSVKNSNTSWAPTMPTSQHYQQQPFLNRTPQVQPPSYRPKQQAPHQGIT